MRKLFFVNLFILISFISFSQNFTGDWKGQIDVNEKSIPIVFHFYSNASGQLDGKWDSPSQGALGIPFTTIVAKGDSLNLLVESISGAYNGKLVNADSIVGTWHQGGASLPLNFKKFIDEDKASLKISYLNEKEISITAANGTQLFGTLLSKNISQRLAIIIAGSGPTDRDGNNAMGVKANSYKMLAHALDSNNIATFRFDKRGIGKSMGKGFKESDLVFDDYINDVEKIFDYLHDTLGFKNIYIIGHSEGSLIGIIASQKKPVKGFVSLAGAGRPVDEVIKEQVKSKPMPDSLKNEINYVFSELKKGKEVNNVPASLNSIFRKSVQPYMISWLKYSPADEIKKLNCPVLIIQGTCDKQVKIIDAENLNKANEKSMLDIIPLMTHTLKDTDANCADENMKTYMDPSLPLDSKLVNDLVTFLKK
jgi:pimeloyl-ACP methyl ester carboxylesterase